MHCSFGRRQVSSDLEVKMGHQIIPQLTKFIYLSSVIHKGCAINGGTQQRIHVRWFK